MKLLRIASLVAAGALSLGVLAPVTAQAEPATADAGAWPGLAKRLAPVVKDARADGVDLGLFVSDLSGGTFNNKTLYLGRQSTFTTASTIKLSLAATVMHQVEAGVLSLNDPATITSSEVIGGSGILKDRPTPISTTVGEMLTLMIQVSDNTATNKLVDVVGGFDPINTLTQDAGIAKAELHFGRKMFGAIVLPDGDLWATPHAYKQLLDLYYNASQGNPVSGFINQASAKTLISLMRGQTVKTKLGATIPGKILAHKTGENDTVSHDLGFILLADREVSIGVFTANTGRYASADWYAAADPYVQQIGAIVYDYVLRDSGDGTLAPVVKAVATKTSFTLNKNLVKARKGGVKLKIAVVGTKTPTGKVAVYDGKKQVRRAALKGGKVTVSLPKGLARGKHRIKVVYLPSSSTFVKSTSSTKIVRVS